MEKIRCNWATKDALYITYHDTEWGVPLHDEQKLFEFLILETFQAGLSWITILRKRENFRKAFDDFDFRKVALYDEVKVQELLLNSGIVRNKLKVRAAISNAKAFIKIQDIKKISFDICEKSLVFEVKTPKLLTYSTYFERFMN